MAKNNAVAFGRYTEETEGEFRARCFFDASVSIINNKMLKQETTANIIGLTYERLPFAEVVEE